MSKQFPERSGRMNRQMHTAFSAVSRLGSADLELAYVAAGWADATALTTINSWDIAAGFHILQRAGGSVRTWPGRDGDASLPAFLQPAYVACSGPERSEEHTSELQSRGHLVCRLLLEKKKRGYMMKCTAIE